MLETGGHLYLNLILKFSGFWPTFKGLADFQSNMDDQIEAELRARGDELRENHDEAIIADVIGEIEALESENSDKTAEILRKMVGFDT